MSNVEFWSRGQNIIIITIKIEWMVTSCSFAACKSSCVHTCMCILVLRVLHSNNSKGNKDWKLNIFTEPLDSVCILRPNYHFVFLKS